MDFGDLLLLLFFLLPVLSRLFGKKKPRPGTPSPDAAERRTEPVAVETDDPLAEALRQIREALGETEPAPSPEPPRPEPVRPSLPKPPPRSRPSPIEPEFHGLGGFEHDAHGFGRENPLSEEVFERRPAFQSTGGTDRIKTKPLASVDLSTPLEVKKTSSSEHARLAAILRDPERVSEAFALTEILGPPRSLKPRR